MQELFPQLLAANPAMNIDNPAVYEGFPPMDAVFLLLIACYLLP
jgi:hypothetical protein